VRVLILADLEGVSGAGDYRLLIPAGPTYKETCENLTRDIDAAVRGLRAAGATEIDVVDGHRTASYRAADYPEAVWAHMSLVVLGALHTFSQGFEKL